MHVFRKKILLRNYSKPTYFEKHTSLLGKDIGKKSIDNKKAHWSRDTRWPTVYTVCMNKTCFNFTSQSC
jgi:hypothetical protein